MVELECEGQIYIKKSLCQAQARTQNFPSVRGNWVNPGVMWYFKHHLIDIMSYAIVCNCIYIHVNTTCFKSCLFFLFRFGMGTSSADLPPHIMGAHQIYSTVSLAQTYSAPVSGVGKWDSYPGRLTLYTDKLSVRAFLNYTKQNTNSVRCMFYIFSDVLKEHKPHVLHTLTANHSYEGSSYMA
jgi:hypothetical protein